MKALRPLLDSALDLRPTDDPGPLPTYRLVSRRGYGAAKLPSHVAGICLMFDGRRTIAELSAELERRGLELPGPDYVGHLARSLERAGIVRLLGRPLRILGTPRVQCQMCSASCSGPEVGPLPAPEVERLREQWAALCQDHPELRERPPVRIDDQGRAFLPRPDGRCSFLGPDRLCRIHARWGLRAKPQACQVFPLVAVASGDEVRLGVSGACARLHETFESAPETDLAAEFEAVQPLVPLERAYAEATPEALDAWDAWVGESEALSVASLAAAAACGPRRDLPGALPAPVAGDLARLARSWAGRYASQLHPDSRYFKHLEGLLQALREGPLDAAALTGAPPRWGRYMAYRMRGALFLRTGYRHGSPARFVARTAVGWAAAHWYARAAGDDYDRFGEALVVWHMATHQPRAASEPLGEAEWQRLAPRWRAAFHALEGPRG